GAAAGHTAGRRAAAAALRLPDGDRPGLGYRELLADGLAPDRLPVGTHPRGPAEPAARPGAQPAADRRDIGLLGFPGYDHAAEPPERVGPLRAAAGAAAHTGCAGGLCLAARDDGPGPLAGAAGRGRRVGRSAAAVGELLQFRDAAGGLAAAGLRPGAGHR